MLWYNILVKDARGVAERLCHKKAKGIRGAIVTTQFMIGAFFLVAGIAYGLYMARSIWTDREWLRNAPGNLGTVIGLEAVVYFLCTIGVSDFLLNTIICQRLKLVGPEAQPDCNITATIVPSGIIAFVYLRDSASVDGLLLVLFIVCLIIGSIVGSQVVGHMKGDIIRKAMVVFLCVTLVCLVVRMILSAGAAPTATSLGGWKLAMMGLTAFVAGFINMLGIPAKPLIATVSLLLGLSPITTLAVTLGGLPTSCLVGGLRVMPKKNYSPKLILSAMTAGSLAAIAGCLMAISVNATVLNVMLLIVIAVAIVSLIKR